MKKLIPKKNYLCKALSLLLILSIACSCKKKEVTEIAPSKTENKAVVQTVSNETLVKFLSISMDAKKSEIVFDALNDEFTIKGIIKYGRVEITDIYNKSNVYQAIYNK